MDTLLETSVLAGLQSLTNANLPIMTSDFYTKYMVPNKPEGRCLQWETRGGEGHKRALALVVGL